MTVELAVIVPTRGRPENLRKVIGAWDFTNAWDVADLIVVADADDPEIGAYRSIVAEDDALPAQLVIIPSWLPMVQKLNRAAVAAAESRLYFAVGFAGDDHLPRTINWARRYLAVLAELKTGMVYGDDGYQGLKLSTEWAVTADVVRELGRMVPADVEHMYCDNAIMELFSTAGALRFLPEVRIEHMHPIAGKAADDAQYKRVNSSAQYHRDRLAYERWRRFSLGEQAATVLAMRRGLPEVRPEPGRRRIETTRRSQGVKMPFPYHFKRIRGATPPEIEVTLADLARQVPADEEIVELGVFQGRTAIVMAWGARQGHGAHVTAIDPWDLPGNVYDPPFTDEGSRKWARYNVNSQGFSSRITLVQGFSHLVAQDWLSADNVDNGRGKPIGLLFVDGDHSETGARSDIVNWSRYLAPGAVIAVDDYGHPDWPGVKIAVDALVAEGVLQPIELFHDRLAVTALADAPAGPRAITGEGVSPSPDVEEFARAGSPRESADPDQVGGIEPTAVTDDLLASLVDTDESTAGVPVDTAWSTEVVAPGELDGVEPGAGIAELTLPDLKALAKTRGIVLGARKDRKDAILRALRDGA